MISDEDEVLEALYKIALVSLGCDKNLVDSEKILAQCRARGYELTDDPVKADAVVINTCCFIDDAKSESIEAILEMAQLKNAETGLPKIIAAGCMAKRYHEDIAAQIPEVDAVCAGLAPQAVADTVDSVFFQSSQTTSSVTDRVTSSLFPYSYLKIADGCDKCCTYCSIPSIRGSYISTPVKDLLEEAKQLANCGVKELNIVAQETTLYGLDLYKKKSLHQLLSKLCEIDGIEWLRVLYCYPEEIDDALIDVIAKEEKIQKYLDIPIQHASDSVLKRMGRGATKDRIVKIIDRLREKILNIALRTTFITGFPGETTEDFEAVCEFVKDMQFEHVGVFCYSRQKGTPADKLTGHIGKRESKKRKDTLLSIQRAIKLSANAKRVNEIEMLPCLVEGFVPESEMYVTRTYRDAPEVDSYLYVRSKRDLMTGDIVMAKVTGTNGYDLMGEAT